MMTALALSIAPLIAGIILYLLCRQFAAEDAANE